MRPGIVCTAVLLLLCASSLLPQAVQAGKSECGKGVRKKHCTQLSKKLCCRSSTAKPADDEKWKGTCKASCAKANRKYSKKYDMPSCMQKVAKTTMDKGKKPLRAKDLQGTPSEGLLKDIGPRCSNQKTWGKGTGMGGGGGSGGDKNTPWGADAWAALKKMGPRLATPSTAKAVDDPIYNPPRYWLTHESFQRMWLAYGTFKGYTHCPYLIKKVGGAVTRSFTSGSGAAPCGTTCAIRVSHAVNIASQFSSSVPPVPQPCGKKKQPTCPWGSKNKLYSAPGGNGGPTTKAEDKWGDYRFDGSPIRMIEYLAWSNGYTKDETCLTKANYGGDHAKFFQTLQDKLVKSRGQPFVDKLDFTRGVVSFRKCKGRGSTHIDLYWRQQPDDFAQKGSLRGLTSTVWWTDQEDGGDKKRGRSDCGKICFLPAVRNGTAAPEIKASVAVPSKPKRASHRRRRANKKKKKGSKTKSSSRRRRAKKDKKEKAAATGTSAARQSRRRRKNPRLAGRVRRIMKPVA